LRSNFGDTQTPASAQATQTRELVWKFCKDEADKQLGGCLLVMRLNSLPIDARIPFAREPLRACDLEAATYLTGCMKSNGCPLEADEEEYREGVRALTAVLAGLCKPSAVEKALNKCDKETTTDVVQPCLDEYHKKGSWTEIDVRSACRSRWKNAMGVCMDLDGPYVFRLSPCYLTLLNGH